VRLLSLRLSGNMSERAPRYPDWKAPEEDGKLVIWPDPASLPAQTLDNARRLASAHSTRIQGLPLPELRSETRAEIGVSSTDQPLVATGHQTELYHAGVWAKLALLKQVSRLVNGRAFHFAVDTDSPKHLNFRWPGRSLPITQDPSISSAAWTGLLSAPSAAHARSLREQLAHDSAAFGYQPAGSDFLKSLADLAPAGLDLPGALTRSMQELDRSLGLQHTATTVSPLLAMQGYLIFVTHLLSRAGAFAASYNRALGMFRRAHGVRTVSRPMPDLFSSADSMETPFWLDDLASGRRLRPSVFPREGAFVLELLSGDEFVFSTTVDAWQSAEDLGRWLKRTNHRLSPRALTLTMFLRLLIADQFVHGIGGGRYDQVTDDIIADFFQLQPPTFSVTTATLLLPQAAGRTRACTSCVIQDGHQLRHRVLGASKMELVRAIDELPRRSPERAALFSSMQQQRKSALIANPALASWQQRLRDTRLREAEDKVIFDRELFYAIQPRDRLEQLIGQYAESFSS
jgi:hypothetical protein